MAQGGRKVLPGFVSRTPFKLSGTWGSPRAGSQRSAGPGLRAPAGGATGELGRWSHQHPRKVCGGSRQCWEHLHTWEIPGGGVNARRPSPLAMAALSGQSACRGLVQGSRRQTGPEGRVGTSRPQGHSGSDFFGEVGVGVSLFFKLSLRVSASLPFEKKIWRFPVCPHTGTAAPHPLSHWHLPHPRDTFVTIDGQSLVSSTGPAGTLPTPPHSRG